MTGPTDVTPPVERGFLAPTPEGQPTDHCVRCGKPTPAGVALCEEHNPHQLRGPSATQMHATVFVGIVLGVIGLFVLFRLAQSDAGPFTAQVTSAVGGQAGAVSVAFDVTNGGGSSGYADCRFTRDGVPRPDDVAFRTPPLTGGETISLQRDLVPDAENGVAYVPGLLSVICQ